MFVFGVKMPVCGDDVPEAGGFVEDEVEKSCPNPASASPDIGG
jgi:hypothetical protein